MKVKDLIKELKSVNQEAIVIMSSDGEGNSYSPLYDLSDEYKYEADSTWSGDIGFKKFTKELEKEGYSEEDCMEDRGVDAVVIYPTN